MTVKWEVINDNVFVDVPDGATDEEIEEIVREEISLNILWTKVK